MGWGRTSIIWSVDTNGRDCEGVQQIALHLGNPVKLFCFSWRYICYMIWNSWSSRINTLVNLLHRIENFKPTNTEENNCCKARRCGPICCNHPADERAYHWQQKSLVRLLIKSKLSYDKQIVKENKSRRRHKKTMVKSFWCHSGSFVFVLFVTYSVLDMYVRLHGLLKGSWCMSTEAFLIETRQEVSDLDIYLCILALNRRDCHKIRKLERNEKTTNIKSRREKNIEWMHSL